MTFTLTARGQTIGRAEMLRWTPDPGHLFLQFFPTAAYGALRSKLEEIWAQRQAELDAYEREAELAGDFEDWDEETVSEDDEPPAVSPYTARAAMAKLGLELKDETGAVVASGLMSIMEAAGG